MVKTEKSSLLVFPTSVGLAFLARVGDIAGFTGFCMRSVTKVFGVQRRRLKKTGRFDLGAFARGVAEILVVRHHTAPNQPLQHNASITSVCFISRPPFGVADLERSAKHDLSFLQKR